jgi:hypothetical protein
MPQNQNPSNTTNLHLLTEEELSQILNGLTIPENPLNINVEEVPVTSSDTWPSLEVSEGSSDTSINEENSITPLPEPVFFAHGGDGSGIAGSNSKKCNFGGTTSVTYGKVVISGKVYPVEKCVLIHKNWYLKTDKNVITDYYGNITHKNYCESYYDFKSLNLNKLEDGSFMVSFKDTLYFDIIKNVNLDRFVYTIECKGYTFKVFAEKEDDLIQAGFKESFKNGNYYINLDELKTAKSPRLFNVFENHYVKNPKEDNLKTNLFLENKDYTFGVEIEASSGIIPTRLMFDIDAHCERDGSINKHMPNKPGGPEIVTSVLKGDLGFVKLKKICDVLSKRYTINKDCGVHVHVGKREFSNEFLFFMYFVALKIENELFSLLPHSRRFNKYCRPLIPVLDFHGGISDMKRYKELYETDTYLYKQSINDFVNSLYVLASKHPLDHKNNKETNHPEGSKCSYNQNTIRYCWLNLIPAMFNTRGSKAYTLEFRNHSASLNFNKIKNWVKLCVGIVDFVDTKQEYILNNFEKIDLNTIIRMTYPKRGDRLIAYMDSRKELFRVSTSEKAEYYKKSNLDNKNKKLKEIICA